MTLVKTGKLEEAEAAAAISSSAFLTCTTAGGRLGMVHEARGENLLRIAIARPRFSRRALKSTEAPEGDEPIESAFATVRHRSKGYLHKTTLVMVFKRVENAQRSWRRLDGRSQLPDGCEPHRCTDALEIIAKPTSRQRNCRLNFLDVTKYWQGPLRLG